MQWPNIIIEDLKDTFNIFVTSTEYGKLLRYKDQGIHKIKERKINLDIE